MIIYDSTVKVEKINLRPDLVKLIEKKILLNNVFGPEPTAKILFYRIDERDYDILKTFLVYLNIMPEVISGIRGKTIRSEDILVEPNILEILLRI